MFCEIVGFGAAIVFGVALLFLDVYAMYTCIYVMAKFFRDNADPWRHEDLVYSFVTPLCIFIFVMFLNIAAAASSAHWCRKQWRKRKSALAGKAALITTSSDKEREALINSSSSQAGSSSSPPSYDAF